MRKTKDLIDAMFDGHFQISEPSPWKPLRHALSRPDGRGADGMVGCGLDLRWLEYKIIEDGHEDSMTSVCRLRSSLLSTKVIYHCEHLILIWKKKRGNR